MTARQFLNAVANGKTDLVAALRDILAEAGAEYCIIGGLAVNAYAEPVVSLDLDLVVALGRLEEVCAAAAARGLKVRRFEHSVNLSGGGSDLRIQLQTDARYQPFLARAAERQVLGYRLRVADVADVLQGKVWAFLDETRRASKRQKDLADILRLVEAHPHLLQGLPQAVRDRL
ncbi:MAG: hypothetical protein FJ291_15030 [Planctomycetes bacterium]|nr:hypothetical protein [Planctomycetota bacterium]